MSCFELAQQPRGINGGSCKYDVRQIYPQTAAIGNSARPGVSGAAVGTTSFVFNHDNLWWIPSLSYFQISGKFVHPSTAALTVAASPTYDLAFAYCDGWCNCLFSQIQYQLNASTVELLQQPAVADTAQLYSTVDRTWLKSFGSASGVGEGFTTRIRNSCGVHNLSTASNEVVASWRPALSIFDCPHGVPPARSIVSTLAGPEPRRRT